MRAEDRTDEQLLRAARGDPSAFGVFYRRHAEAVLAFLLYRCRDPEQALDLMAETFAVVLERPGRFRPEAGTGRAWLIGIARNLERESRRDAAAVDKVRRRLGLDRLVFDDAELERVAELIDLERREPPLTELLGGLSPGQRSAVLARVVDEREYADIARELDVTQHTVRQWVSRGLARLKERADHA